MKKEIKKQILLHLKYHGYDYKNRNGKIMAEVWDEFDGRYTNRWFEITESNYQELLVME